MRAEQCWQELNAGIDLLNLLAYYPAPSNPAILAALERLMDEDRLSAALSDLDVLEQRLIQLPESSGETVTEDLPPIREDGPLGELLTRLGLLHRLFEGKQGAGATSQIQEQLRLSRPVFKNLTRVKEGLLQLHRLKSP